MPIPCKHLAFVLFASWMMYIALITPAYADDTLNFTHDFNALKALPSFSLLAPSGFTPTQDFVSLGAGAITNTPTAAKDTSSAISLGFGIKLPANFGISLNVDMDGNNLSQRQELSMAMGKYFKGSDLGISFGIRNMTLWHDDGSRNIPSAYLAASKMLLWHKQLVILNIGLGNNDFRTISDISSSTDRAQTVSAFASAAYYPLPQVSFIADYTAGISSFGIGFVPLVSWPFSFNLGIYDVTKAIPTHNKTSFIASFSMSYTF